MPGAIRGMLPPCSWTSRPSSQAAVETWWRSTVCAWATPAIDSTGRVDDWLCRLLVPDGRTLPFRELVLEHGYPDEDLGYLEQEEAWGLDD